MKNCFLFLVLLTAFLVVIPFSSNSQVTKTSLGKWSFEAPGAPDGYTYGIIEITKDSVKTSFTTTDFTFPSVWVRAKNDSIIYKSIIDGTDVVFSLKLEDELNIRGNAIWSDGEAVMILKKKE
jgi:hypothetical protein